jgi:HSP20 family protein
MSADLDAWVDGLWRDFGITPAASPAAFNPRIDVSETDEELRICAELPGLEEKDFEVTLDADVVTIAGEKRVEAEADSGGVHRVERSRGAFRRAFRVPFEPAADGVSARFANGVLTVTLSKPESSRPQTRTIPVTTS